MDIDFNFSKIIVNEINYNQEVVNVDFLTEKGEIQSIAAQTIYPHQGENFISNEIQENIITSKTIIEVKLNKDSPNLYIKIDDLKEILNPDQIKNLREGGNAIDFLKQQVQRKLHKAFDTNNIEMLKLIAENAPDEFKAAVTMKDRYTEYAPITRAINSNNIEMVKLIAKIAPDEFKAVMKMEAENNLLIIAIWMGNIEMVNLIAKTVPDEFKAVLTMQDENGYNPLVRPILNENIEMVNLIAEAAPNEFKVAVIMKELNGFTPLVVAIKSGNIEMVKLIAKTAPDEFKAAMTMKDLDGYNPLVIAIRSKNIEMMNLIAKTAPDIGYAPLIIAIVSENIEMVKFLAKTTPEESKAAVKMQEGRDLWTLLEGDVYVNSDISMEMLKLITEAAPNEFKAALTMKDLDRCTLLARAVENNNIEMVKLIAKNAPDEFKAAMTMQDRNEDTPLTKAVENNNIEMVKLIAENAPDEFKAAMTMQDRYKCTPLAKAVENNNIEMVKLIAENAPDEFKATMTMQDENGRTPLILTLYNFNNINIELIKFLIEKSPDSLLQLLHPGESVHYSGAFLLSFFKMLRPSNYREITKLFKKNLVLKQLQKAQLERKALSHAWHLSGITHLITTGEKKTLATFDLEGHRSPEWFHLMGKNLNSFKESYPDLLSENQMTLLKQLFEVGSNADSYSLEDKLKMIKAGLPIIINTGHPTHAVTLLIWGDLFVICNRGDSSRKPIEVFHFNPLKFDSKDLLKIENNAINGTRRDYQELFFEELPQKLEFSQSKLDHQFEAVSQLPFQTANNCSIVSPFTAIYAFMLIESVRGVNEAGALSVEAPEPSEPSLIDSPSSLDGKIEEKGEKNGDERIKKAFSLYQTWLSNQQISILEMNIKPLEQGNLVFEPDHALIMAALRKAHLLPLDHHSQKRLEKLTEIYLNSLDQEKRIAVKSDLVSCQSLPRVSLL